MHTPTPGSYYYELAAERPIFSLHSMQVAQHAPNLPPIHASCAFATLVIFFTQAQDMACARYEGGAAFFASKKRTSGLIPRLVNHCFAAAMSPLKCEACAPAISAL